MKKSAKISAFVVMTALMSACSVTDLKQPITELSSAVVGSTNAIQKLDTELTDTMNERWRRDIIAGVARLRPKDGTCANNKKRCSLVVKLQTEEWTDFPLVSVMPKAHVGLEAIKAYVTNLKAIVDADTAGKVTASANQALGSLKNLEGQAAKAKRLEDQAAKAKRLEDQAAKANRLEDQVAKANRKEASGILKKYETLTSESIAWFAVQEAIAWFTGQYVEAVKYRALAKVTKDADGAIAELARYHERLAKPLTDVELPDISLAFRIERNEFRRKAGENALKQADISELLVATNVYDKVLKASHSRPLKAFAAAHAKLTLHLNGDGTVSLSEASSYIDTLKDEAKVFEGLVDKFTKLNEESN